MPVVVVLHKGDAFALDGIGDEGGGLPGRTGYRLQGGGEGRQVVAVELDGVPAVRYAIIAFPATISGSRPATENCPIQIKIPCTVTSQFRSSGSDVRLGSIPQ